MTIHLIARQQAAENPQPQPQSQPQPQQTQPQSQPQPQPQSQQIPRPPQIPPFQIPPGFNLFGMMGQPGPTVNISQDNSQNQFAQNINNAVNNLMGNLGIRIGPIVPPQPSQPNQQVPQPQPQVNNNQPLQPTQFPQIPQTQPQSQSQQQSVNQGNNRVNPSSNYHESYRNLDQLSQNINRINLPAENQINFANSREHAIHYLRTLQNNILRLIPQLNRGIQLLQ